MLQLQEKKYLLKVKYYVVLEKYKPNICESATWRVKIWLLNSPQWKRHCAFEINVSIKHNYRNICVLFGNNLYS